MNQRIHAVASGAAVGGIGLLLVLGVLWIASPKPQPLAASATTSTPAPRSAQAICTHADISIGMERHQLIESCGMPATLNISNSVGVFHEQFVYGGPNSLYVYTENGRVSSWQATYHPDTR